MKDYLKKELNEKFASCSNTDRRVSLGWKYGTNPRKVKRFQYNVSFSLT